jgi:hypothetical protein
MAAAMVPRRPRASDKIAVGMRAIRRRVSCTMAPQRVISTIRLGSCPIRIRTAEYVEGRVGIRVKEE